MSPKYLILQKAAAAGRNVAVAADGAVQDLDLTNPGVDWNTISAVLINNWSDTTQLKPQLTTLLAGLDAAMHTLISFIHYGSAPLASAQPKDLWENAGYLQGLRDKGAPQGWPWSERMTPGAFPFSDVIKEFANMPGTSVASCGDIAEWDRRLLKAAEDAKSYYHWRPRVKRMLSPLVALGDSWPPTAAGSLALPDKPDLEGIVGDVCNEMNQTFDLMVNDVDGAGNLKDAVQALKQNCTDPKSWDAFLKAYDKVFPV